MKRKFLKILGWTLAVACGLFLILLFTVDFWAPSIIRPILAEQGVTFDAITKEDGHYTLTDVAYAGEGVSAKIGELQSPTLWRLAAKRWFDPEIAANVFINAGVLVITPQETSTSIKPETPEPLNLPSLASDVLGYWETAFQWVDFVETNHFEIYLEPEAKPLPLDITLNADKLNLLFGETNDLGLVEGGLGDIGASISRVGPGLLNLQAKADHFGLLLDSRIAVTTNVAVEGKLTYRDTGRIDFSAVIEPGSYIPESAAAGTTDFVLPAELYTVPDYKKPGITLRADWDGAKADIDLTVTAAPRDQNLPPLKVALKARGDDQIVNVEQFNAEAWSSKIALSKPLRVDLNNLKDLPDAELTVDLNLSDIPDQRLDGRLRGALVVDHQPGGGWPLLTADFAGQSLRCEAFTLRDLAVRAQLDYPALNVERLDASVGEGTKLTATVAGDVEARALKSAELELIADESLLATLVPIIGEQDFAFQSLTLKATASGPMETPRHAGELRMDGLKLKEGLAMNIAGEWDADWLAFSKLNFSAQNERSGVELTASASLAGPDYEATINTARLDVLEQPELELEAPFTVNYGADGVRISPLRLASESGGELRLRGEVDYPRAGEVELAARDVSAVWLDLVLDEPLPYQVKLDELDLAASWDDGPLSATFKLDGGLIPDGQPEVELIADAALAEGKLGLTSLSIVQGEFKLLEARGEIPVLVTPAGESPWTLAEKAPIDFMLKAEPDDSPWWNQLEDRISVDFIRPVIDLSVAGDASAPTGKIDLHFDALQVLSDQEDKRELPRVEQGDFRVTLSPDQLALPRGQLSIAGQALTLEASTPMGNDAWQALLEGERPDWRQATAKVEFTDVPLTAFADWLPDVLRNEGDISLRASLKPGENVRGSLDIDHVATRPLAQLGAINGINAALRLDGQELRVERAEANIGGAPINVSGTVRLTEDWQPRFDLGLKGDNVPLARSPGIVLRGSPDITLRTDEAGVTTLGGVLQLNESFFTKDFADFQSGGGGAARGVEPAKPPFFSIKDEPLASWRLKLQLEGDRFLRVRVPTFEGVVSADFSLRGSLRNPLMFGAAEPQRGVVMFPFATLRLEEGEVSISQNQPDVMRLDVTGSGRAYGYDLIMRVTGTASDPVVSFTSTPSLEQSDIIMMITSGQIPEHARSTESRLSGIGMYLGRSILVDVGLIDPLDDTLTVNVGEDVTTSGKDTINIRYKINDDWDVVGAYDKYDEYYLDFEWTVYAD